VVFTFPGLHPWLGDFGLSGLARLAMGERQLLIPINKQVVKRGGKLKIKN